MADESAAQSFVEHFLNPLLQGDVVTIGLPIDRSTFEELEADVATRSDRVAGLEVILQMQADRMFPVPPLLVFDAGALRIAVAMYQLLFSFHAAAEQGRVSEKRLGKLAADTARMLAQVSTTGERAEVVLYHLLVDPFFLLYRKDVQIFFRAGSKQFFGQDVEWLRLPFRWRVQYEEVLGTDVAAGMFSRATGRTFGMLLEYSPLTRLLRADRLFEEFTWPGLEPVLDDQMLCRFAINTLVDRGIEDFMPAFGSAFRALAHGAADGHAAYAARVARFLVTLVLTNEQWRPEVSNDALLAARYEPPSDAMRFEAPGVDAEAAQRGETDRSRRQKRARDAWALVGALLTRHDVLRLPSADRRSAPSKALQRRLEAMRPELGDALPQMHDIVRRTFPP